MNNFWEHCRIHIHVMDEKMLSNILYCWFTVCSGDFLKISSENTIKNALKMTSQLVIFRAFFHFFSSPDPKPEKKIPVNQLIKKFWPYPHLVKNKGK